MFLEETIESLDNEDDSGLSHDEPEQLPASGNISAKLADLSLSLAKSNINSEFIFQSMSDYDSVLTESFNKGKLIFWV